ncbi:MAG: PAS-domain containing protein [Janthinobacterium lividum]
MKQVAADFLASSLPLQPLVEALDSLGIAVCLFDDDDRLMRWNRSFLAFFPEHVDAIAVGEPYVLNLRRFYEKRLNAQEMPRIERYIQEGVARHRTQQRPFAFEHRGRRLLVASLPVPGIGRVRIWRHDEGTSPLDAAASMAIERLNLPDVDGTALFDHVADGVMVSGADRRIVWVNRPFVKMYGFSHRDAAIGLTFEDAYRSAWLGFEGHERVLFESGLAVLDENMRFAGAPFEVPLPDDRWSRVVEQRGPDDKHFFAHVDITVLKRQQNGLQAAERRARESEALLRQKSVLLETTFECMEQGIMMVNAEGIVEVCNDRVLQLLDLPRDLMATRPPFADVVAYQWAHEEFARTAEELLPMMKPDLGIESIPRYDRERPDGRVIEVSVVPIEGGGVVRTYTDITERKRNEERIRHLASHDGLTSLINREVFLEHLAGAVESSVRGGAGFAVHYIDID